MKLIDFLQGKWLGHPLHPAIVHIPVGTWLTACVTDIVLRVHPMSPALSRLSMYCVVVGLIGAALAVPTGIAEWTPIKKERPAWKLGLYHLTLNLLAALAWATNLGLRVQSFDSTRPVTVPVLVTSILGAGLILVSGYLGCLLAFDQGTSVGRQSKKKWRSIAAQGGARLPESK